MMEQRLKQHEEKMYAGIEWWVAVDGENPST
jgi:hypothetical protein